jgi:hypothetical protein
MSIPRNLGNFADNVNVNGKVEVTGINATGTPSSTTVLAGNGSWVTPSAGAMVFISSQTISSPVASVDFTSGFSSTYDDYLVIYDNLTVSAQDNLYLRIYKNGSLVTASYTMEILRGTSTTAAAATDLNRVEITLGGTIRTTTIQSLGTIRVLNANNTNVGLLFNTSCLDNSSTSNNFVNVGGVTNTATGITSGLKFYLAAGNNIATGTFKLYGIAKS